MSCSFYAQDGTCPTLAQDVSLYNIAHDERCHGFS